MFTNLTPRELVEQHRLVYQQFTTLLSCDRPHLASQSSLTSCSEESRSMVASAALEVAQRCYTAVLETSRAIDKNTGGGSVGAKKDGTAEAAKSSMFVPEKDTKVIVSDCASTVRQFALLSATAQDAARNARMATLRNELLEDEKKPICPIPEDEFPIVPSVPVCGGAFTGLSAASMDPEMAPLIRLHQGFARGDWEQKKRAAPRTRSALAMRFRNVPQIGGGGDEDDEEEDDPPPTIGASLEAFLILQALRYADLSIQLQTSTAFGNTRGVVEKEIKEKTDKDHLLVANALLIVSAMVERWVVLEELEARKTKEKTEFLKKQYVREAIRGFVEGEQLPAGALLDGFDTVVGKGRSDSIQAPTPLTEEEERTLHVVKTALEENFMANVGIPESSVERAKNVFKALWTKKKMKKSSESSRLVTTATPSFVENLCETTELPRLTMWAEQLSLRASQQLLLAAESVSAKSLPNLSSAATPAAPTELSTLVMQEGFIKQREASLAITQLLSSAHTMSQMVASKRCEEPTVSDRNSTKEAKLSQNSCDTVGNASDDDLLDLSSYPPRQQEAILAVRKRREKLRRKEEQRRKREEGSSVNGQEDDRSSFSSSLSSSEFPELGEPLLPTVKAASKVRIAFDHCDEATISCTHSAQRQFVALPSNNEEGEKALLIRKAKSVSAQCDRFAQSIRDLHHRIRKQHKQQHQSTIIPSSTPYEVEVQDISNNGSVDPFEPIFYFIRTAPQLAASTRWLRSWKLPPSSEDNDYQSILAQDSLLPPFHRPAHSSAASSSTAQASLPIAEPLVVEAFLKAKRRHSVTAPATSLTAMAPRSVESSALTTSEEQGSHQPLAPHEIMALMRLPDNVAAPTAAYPPSRVVLSQEATATTNSSNALSTSSGVAGGYGSMLVRRRSQRRVSAYGSLRGSSSMTPSPTSPFGGSATGGADEDPFLRVRHFMGLRPTPPSSLRAASADDQLERAENIVSGDHVHPPSQEDPLAFINAIVKNRSVALMQRVLSGYLDRRDLGFEYGSRLPFSPHAEKRAASREGVSSSSIINAATLGSGVHPLPLPSGGNHSRSASPSALGSIRDDAQTTNSRRTPSPTVSSSTTIGGLLRSSSLSGFVTTATVSGNNVSASVILQPRRPTRERSGSDSHGLESSGTSDTIGQFTVGSATFRRGHHHHHHGDGTAASSQQGPRTLGRRGTVMTLQTKSLAEQAAKRRERIVHLLQCYVRRFLARTHVKQLQRQVEKRRVQEEAAIRIQQLVRKVFARVECGKKQQLRDFIVEETLPLSVEETDLRHEMENVTEPMERNVLLENFAQQCREYEARRAATIAFNEAQRQKKRLPVKESVARADIIAEEMSARWVIFDTTSPASPNWKKNKRGGENVHNGNPEMMPQQEEAAASRVVAAPLFA